MQIKIDEITKKGKQYEVVFIKNNEILKYLLPEDVLIKFVITKSKTIDNEDFKEIIKYTKYITFYNKALNFISFKTINNIIFI
ncbi:unnamed protein product [marine sediment metagenome]|uniref:Uncharacterized protein n=1 Tax=marine sediment metagenome TaxID=412755 RepID=X1B3E7_9ZZZZ